LAVLEPSFEYFTNPVITCDKKEEGWAKKPRTSFKEARRKVAQANGCFKISDKVTGETEDFEYYICPCRIADPIVIDFVRSARLLEKGVLPYSGGYMDQPALYMEMLELTSVIIAEKQENEMKKNQRKSK